jgi:hypothetical protein
MADVVQELTEAFLPPLGADAGLDALPSVTLLARRRSPSAFPAFVAEVFVEPSVVCGLDLVGSDENSFADRPQQLAFEFFVGPVCGDGEVQRPLVLMPEVFVRDALVKPLDYVAESVFEALVA